MGTTLTTEACWYRVGSNYPATGCVGYDGWPLVARFKFHTPGAGASSLNWVTQRFDGDYVDYQAFNYLITAESTGYESECGDGGVRAAVVDGKLSGSSQVQLMPDAEYYLWIWPRTNRYGRARIGGITLTVDGSYGTASAVSAGDGTFGSQIPVSLTATGQGAQHTVTVSCAGRTETLLTDSSATSCVWTPDLATYAALLSNSGSAQATISCVTKYAGNTVGTTTKTITVSFAAGALAPILTAGWAAAAVYNTGSAAAGLSIYVQGHSKAQVSFDSTKISCRYGASVAGYKIRCSGVTVSASPYRTPVLTGDAEIVCTVTDSRGQEASATLQVTVQPYAEPRLTEVTVFRCDSQGVAADDGQYYSAKGKGLYSPLSGQNSMTLTAAHKTTESASYGTEHRLQNDTALVIGTISPDSSYLVRLTVTDALGSTATATVALATQKWAMKFRPGGMGVGFGKAPEHDNCLELPSGWVIRIGSTVVLSE